MAVDIYKGQAYFHLYSEQFSIRHLMGIYWHTSPTHCEAALTRWARELLRCGTVSEHTTVSSFMIAKRHMVRHSIVEADGYSLECNFVCVSFRLLFQAEVFLFQPYYERMACPVVHKDNKPSSSLISCCPLVRLHFNTSICFHTQTCHNFLTQCFSPKTSPCASLLLNGKVKQKLGLFIFLQLRDFKW